MAKTIVINLLFIVIIYKQTVPGAGRDFGLMVNLDIEKKYYRGSTRPYAGASIIIHHPTEYPEVDVRSAIIQPSQEVSILLSGTIIESGPGIRSLPVDSRNCFFEDEVYTIINIL